MSAASARAPQARPGRDGDGWTAPGRARGGLSGWSVLSGVLVAFGAFVLLSGIVGALLGLLGVTAGGVRVDDATAAGVGGAVALVLAQFLAYAWGGYTAGRMARGSGLANGLAVAVVALVLVIVLGALLTLATRTTPAADVQRLPLPLGAATEVLTGVGLALLVAMLLGAALGGVMGARWHARLEDRQLGRPSP